MTAPKSVSITFCNKLYCSLYKNPLTPADADSPDEKSYSYNCEHYKPTFDAQAAA